MIDSAKVEGSRQRLSFFFACLISCLLGAPALAAAPQMIDVSLCINISDSQLRLSCYDTAAKVTRPKAAIANQASGSSASKADSKLVSSVEQTYKQEPVAQVKTTSQLPAKNPRKQAAEFLVVAEITEAKQIAHGKWLLTLANNQIWQETEPGRNRYKKGQTVTIKASFMGSYSLSVKGKTTRKFKPVH
ncbi:MAG: hypothetical protein ACJAYE_002020 [Candidatus Azotimanducaceae bacterium]|jgi:hypothetical protein